MDVATSETRALDGVLASWGDAPSAVFFSIEQNAPVVVSFDRSAWRGASDPEYGQTVQCRQSIARTLVAPGGWGHTKDLHFRNLLCDQISKEIRRATVNEGESVMLEFLDGSSISLSLRPEEYTGPEAVLVQGLHGELMVL